MARRARSSDAENVVGETHRPRAGRATLDPRYERRHTPGMSKKSRVTLTLDPQLLEAASAAVAEGRASSVSQWVNDAVAAQVESERRLRALDEAIRAYESEFGEITAQDVAAQRLADRREAAANRARLARRKAAKARRPA